MKKLITLLIFIGIINMANAQFFAGANLKGGTGMLNYSGNFPKAKFSYGGGVNFGYELKKHFYFSTGIDYYRINFQLTPLVARPHYIGYHYDPNYNYGPYTVSRNYFTLPLEAGYFYQFKNNIRLFADMGLLFSMTDGNVGTLSDNFSAELSLGYTGKIGIGYKIKSILLTLAGEYSHMNNIHSFKKHHKPDAYLYGLNIGLRYYF